MPPELIRVAELPSTMEAAHALAQDGAPHGTAVVAARQTLGRGTRGRAWSSGPRRVVAVGGRAPVADRRARGAVVARRAGRRGGTGAGLPGAPAARPQVAQRSQVDGRKLAGILCEARWGGGQCQWVVIGLGVNVRNAIPADLRSAAVGIGSLGPDRRSGCARSAGRRRRCDGRARSRSADAAELQAYALRDVLAGARVSEPVAGTAEGITATGALRVRTDTGPMREVLAGVVALAVVTRDSA